MGVNVESGCVNSTQKLPRRASRDDILGTDLKKSDCFESIPKSFASHPIDSIRFEVAAPKAVSQESGYEAASFTMPPL
jgi:hypothetical protein